MSDVALLMACAKVEPHSEASPIKLLYHIKRDPNPCLMDNQSSRVTNHVHTLITQRVCTCFGIMDLNQYLEKMNTTTLFLESHFSKKGTYLGCIIDSNWDSLFLDTEI